MSFGGMGSDGDDDKVMSEINMTPLIDIMLVLLIIFMVTSSVSIESGLDIDLPNSASGESQGKPEGIIVALDKKGVISVQGKAISFDKLKEEVGSALLKEKTGLVIFEGDENASLGKTIEIMDIAKAAGAIKFAIATEQDGS